MSLKCRLGFHDWRDFQGLSVWDWYVGQRDRFDYTCTRCGKQKTRVKYSDGKWEWWT